MNGPPPHLCSGQKRSATFPAPRRKRESVRGFAKGERAPYLASTRSAFSLVEIMVAVGLMGVIIVGLLAMFNQTQRAFRGSVTQVDVLEGGRTVIDMVKRDLLELAPWGRQYETNAYGFTRFDPMVQLRPFGLAQTNIVQDVFFLSRINSDEWTGTGYFVIATDAAAAGLAGTLYRFTATAPWNRVHLLYPEFQRVYQQDWTHALMGKAITNSHRVIDGVVHFRIVPYNERGLIDFDFVDPVRGNFVYTNNAVPAYADVELGVLETRAYEQFIALKNNPARSYENLRDQVGRVHLFRQHIPIRNAR